MCVVKYKAITVLLGAVVASSFSSPTKFGAGSPADAADAIPLVRPDAVKIPEFVPVINFSEFIMATQTFAAQNPPAARLAAEALSAKFTAGLESQGTEQHQASQQSAELSVAKPAPIIITRPVVVASIPSVPSISVPDPIGRPAEALADPVKIVTGYPAEKTRRHKAEKKVAATTSHDRVEKRFEPAMGLGMVVDSAEEAPPISAVAPKKRKAATVSRNIE